MTIVGIAVGMSKSYKIEMEQIRAMQKSWNGMEYSFLWNIGWHKGAANLRG
jgi:hypothetical protein